MARWECTEKLWHSWCYTGMEFESSSGISAPTRKNTVTPGIKCIWKKSFLGSRGWWGCVLMTCDATVCFSSSSLSLGQEHPLTKPSRMGNRWGGGVGAVLGKQDCRAGEAPASAEPSPGLWPRQSFWWCTSGFTWARHRRPCWLSKQPSHRTLLSHPLGSSHRLRVLCASLSRAHSVLWAFPLYFTPALHSVMPRFITPFQINRAELNSRTGSSPPASLLQENAAPVCEQGLWPINISYPNPAAAYSSPFPSPTLSHKKREDAERQQVLGLKRMWCGSQDLLLCCTHHGKR